MKRLISLILAVLIVAFGIIRLTKFFKHRSMINSAHSEFIIITNNVEKARFSLDRRDASTASNIYFLNSVVGTLVKYGLSGRIEPYLAESWTVSNDKREWNFKIRPGLACQDGSVISAKLIRDNLENNLRQYAGTGSVIMFDHLHGWQDFKTDERKALSGLKVVDGNILQFKFDDNPDDLLELLRMPYFGLWQESNGKLISSGPYAIENFSSQEVNLRLRPEWFTSTVFSIKNVSIRFANEPREDAEIPPNTMMKFPLFSKKNNFRNGYWIENLPVILEGIALSPYKKSLFSDVENRRIFIERIKSQLETQGISTAFYPSALTAEHRLQKKEYSHKDSGVLEFSLQRHNYSNAELTLISTLIKNALEGSGFEFRLVPASSDDPQRLDRENSNSYFDGRIFAVDVGAYPSYLGLKMMFCSKMGVSFPDPSGRICEMTRNRIKESRVLDQNFVNEFNSILLEDATIVPLGHYAEKWFVSESLDPRTLPSTTVYPQFELIRMR